MSRPGDDTEFVTQGGSPMMHRYGILVVLFASLFVTPSVSLGEDEFVPGRYRIDLMNRKSLEGDVKKLEDGSYEVKMGIATLIVRPNEVKRIVALEDVTRRQGDISASDDGISLLRPRREITDEEIEEILSGITAEYDESIRGNTREDLMAELPLDEESLEEMKRLMGDDARVLIKPHFVMVYTSSDQSARELGARLESVWRHNVAFMDRLDIPARLPDSKLEIFYFGTWKEFNSYNLNQGSFMPIGVAGYYSPDWNRSHFFDFNKSPFVAEYDVIIDNPNADWRDRQLARNQKRRLVEYQNMEVIQHETGHHIHFNIGLFPRDSFGGGGVPIWLVEGTTMLFEVPPTAAGASIGVLNHYRLYMLRKTWGKHPLSPEDWKLFLIDNRRWRGFHSYQLGWAIVYYLYKEHREPYAEYLRSVFGRDEGYEMTMGEREREFENLFGRVDEDWVNDFYDFLDELNVKKSALPYKEQEEFDTDINVPPRRMQDDDSRDDRSSDRDRSRGRSRGGGRRRP